MSPRGLDRWGGEWLGYLPKNNTGMYRKIWENENSIERKYKTSNKQVEKEITFMVYLKIHSIQFYICIQKINEVYQKI